ncbi:carbon starvation CstA family protein [Pseudomonas sp. KNUC1026]|uniref:carbon starvation CstA family protein n=1 Tax=Pseudomonas sp. KNUC1026 TaxID=2893890 RepID=UPI001F401F6E|nr:carbon starvation CstA family protein [Pseudomonas sp. KNUC1026]UFH48826.1 carbon starvation protein A [Pseudomonas sp. KNUC1026]
MKNTASPARHLPWLVLAVIGACALGVVALRRGESINALWIVVAAVSLYLVAYRYYSLFIANKVMQLDPRRATPAVVNNDGLDYVPTNKHILFGHHFAAIAGAGPLVGPVLAAQMGYLPGTLWLIAGVVFAGAVQDFVVLFLSTRRNGRSLGDMVREEMGQIPGTIALFGCFLIMIIILAVLALIVVKALAESPWGVFTVMATIPIAVFMGVYMRYIRPGRIGEISLIGVVLLLLSIYLGGQVAADPTWAKAFTFTGVQITWMLIGYGFVAAVLPVWLILAPRDYLSTFLKIGTIIALAIGILITMPELKMPALTQFTDGTGPVWKGTLFPFLFITIACGAVSGFHALISSGTTPKLLDNEVNARYIGYGGMLMESFVAIMAMVAASVIEPGVYFAMNSPAAVVGTDVTAVAAAVSNWGFAITPDALQAVANDIGEHTILARAGGAPTLAVGIAQILHQVLPGQNTMAFWYHFAILFEALFILTAVDAGTRAGRFMLQDLLGTFVPSLKRTESWGANMIGTAGCVALWGYLLYQGVVDPLGGINTLWPLFGISNQMLAGIALMLGTVVLIKMKRERYVWVTLLPAVWLLICTTTAGLIKLLDPNPAVGFLALARKYSDALAAGQVLAPAKSAEQMHQVMVNAYTNATLTVLFLIVVFSVLIFALRTGYKALGRKERTDKEAPFQALGGQQ